MPYRCRGRDCKRYFSVKTGTVLTSGQIPLQIWVWAIFLGMISLTGLSGMKLHRNLEIRQGSAGHMLHRTREGLLPEILEVFKGPIEVEEVFIGELEKNNHEDKKLSAGRRTVGKSPVFGIKDRKTNQFQAKVKVDPTKHIIRKFVNTTRSRDALALTYDHVSYEGLTNHTSVNHSQKQPAGSTTFVELAHTNGVESFWATLKRAYHGTDNHLTKKHSNRYVTQFAGKHNLRDLDTMDQLKSLVLGMAGKRLRYRYLTT